MIKSDLIAQLINAKNNYILILASISLFNDKSIHPILANKNCSFGSYSISFSQIANLMSSSNDRKIACEELLKSGLRALIKESFELINNYCRSSNQILKMKNESWYQFSRIIRNCLSHNFMFQFNNYDRRILPVNWKSKTIDISFDNTFLDLSFWGYVETWELYNEMFNFVSNSLN